MVGRRESVLVQVRLPRRLVEEIDRLVEEGYYSSRSSFFEDAVRRRLEELSVVRDEVSSLVLDYLSGRIEKVFGVGDVVDVNVEEARHRLEELGLESVERALDRVRGRVK